MGAALLLEPLCDGVVTLRRPEPRDLAPIRRYIDGNDAQAWLSGAGDAAALYAEFRAAWEEPPRPNRLGLTVAIASASDDVLVGVLHLDSAGQTLFVSYGVAPDQRRKGIATRAVALVRSWAHELGFTRIELEIGDDNRASQALARRCGFAPTGTTRSQVTEDGTTWRAATWALEP